MFDNKKVLIAAGLGAIGGGLLTWGLTRLATKCAAKPFGTAELKAPKVDTPVAPEPAEAQPEAGVQQQAHADTGKGPGVCVSLAVEAAPVKVDRGVTAMLGSNGNAWCDTSAPLLAVYPTGNMRHAFIRCVPTLGNLETLKPLQDLYANAFTVSEPYLPSAMYGEDFVSKFFCNRPGTAAKYITAAGYSFLIIVGQQKYGNIVVYPRRVEGGVLAWELVLSEERAQLLGYHGKYKTEEDAVKFMNVMLAHVDFFQDATPPAASDETVEPAEQSAVACEASGDAVPEVVQETLQDIAARLDIMPEPALVFHSLWSTTKEVPFKPEYWTNGSFFDPLVAEVFKDHLPGSEVRLQLPDGRRVLVVVGTATTGNYVVFQQVDKHSLNLFQQMKPVLAIELDVQCLDRFQSPSTLNKAVLYLSQLLHDEPVEIEAGEPVEASGDAGSVEATEVASDVPKVTVTENPAPEDQRVYSASLIFDYAGSSEDSIALALKLTELKSTAFKLGNIHESSRPLYADWVWRKFANTSGVVYANSSDSHTEIFIVGTHESGNIHVYTDIKTLNAPVTMSMKLAKKYVKKFACGGDDLEPNIPVFTASDFLSMLDDPNLFNLSN